MRVLHCLLVLVPLVCFGAEECTDKPECWPEGSAMRTGLLRRAAETALRSELQQSYQELVDLVSTKTVENGVEYLDDQRLVDAIQAQQKAWEQFKGAECETNLTSQRLKPMRDAITCVKKVAPEARTFERQSCLYQLAPLAVPLER